MAYIDQDTKKKIMSAIAKAFPSSSGWKITGKVRNYSSLTITIRQAPIDMLEGVQLTDPGYKQCGPWLMNGDSGYVHADILKRIDTIVKSEGNWYDKSDAMIDYFETAFYFYIEIGGWDKPFVKV